MLCVILAAAILVAIFFPNPRKEKRGGQQRDNRLDELIEHFSDSLDNAGWSGKERPREIRSYRRDYGSKSRDNYKESTERKVREHKTVTLDINHADTTQLQRLYGIGPVLATRIVKYRNLLGGFIRKEQLLEVYGISQECYDRIEGQLTVDSNAVQRIDINKATFEQLRRHPYLDNYQAKAIINYLHKGQHIDSLQDMIKINLIDATTIKKLQGYIQFN